ncbi:DoxX-like protein [Maribacter vaceletii]|uniref:DoxX-like protein n=1 Tax=Maribacter vaceletii TaxID=1206816 RepID=A0A495EE09_9FLAO|nr:DoxX family protein [Maribacter vaceletii]RKR14891.1 DoxX-like protein [Maribacter vaceletii]
MKTQKIIYWIATGLLTVLMLFSASMYFFKHEMIKEAFTSFGYPTYIIYPLAVAKLLGLGVIASNKGGALKEWAYAGFFFDFVLAFFAHYMISDGQQSLAVVGLVVLLASYFLGKKVRP